MNYKKFVINLDRRPDRYSEFKGRFGSFSDDVIRFSAVDGKKFVSEGVMTEFERKLFSLGSFYRSREAELGVWLSHYRLWKRLLGGDEDAFVIFEDDAFPISNFGVKFNEIMGNINASMTIVYFGGRFREDFKPRDMNPWVKDGIFYFVDKNAKYSGKDMDRTFHGYVITRKGARMLVDEIEKQVNDGNKIAAIDGWVSYLRQKWDSRDYFPHLTHSPSNYKSDISRKAQ